MITTKADTTLATHHPVDIQLCLSCRDFYIDMLVRPPRPADKPVCGPHLPSNSTHWIKWAAAWDTTPFAGRTSTFASEEVDDDILQKLELLIQCWIESATPEMSSLVAASPGGGHTCHCFKIKSYPSKKQQQEEKLAKPAMHVHNKEAHGNETCWESPHLSTCAESSYKVGVQLGHISTTLSCCLGLCV